MNIQHLLSQNNLKIKVSIYYFSYYNTTNDYVQLTIILIEPSLSIYTRCTRIKNMIRISLTHIQYLFPSWKGQSEQSNATRRHVRQQICHEEKRGPTSRPNKKITQNGRRHRSTYGTSISSFLRETKSTTRPFPAVPSTETLFRPIILSLDPR